MRHAEYQDIYTNFANTEYGKQLKASMRWEKYNLGGLSNEDWCDLIGDDANNLYHMHVTYDLAKQFVDHQNMSDKTSVDAHATSLLLLSAIIHDQAEAITGDISYGDKSQQDESLEITVFENHLDSMNPKMSTSTKNMAKSAIRGVIFDDTTPEGAVFNAVERTGYLITALNVAKAAPTIHNPKVVKGLNWLVTDVLANQIAPLVDCAEKYSLPEEILLQNADLISQRFADTPIDIFDRYEKDSTQKQDTFKKARQAWVGFCLAHSYN